MAKPRTESPKKLIVLGSTGSVGSAALDVAAGLGGAIEIVGLAAGGASGALEKQIEKFAPKYVAVSHAAAARRLRPLARRCGFKLISGPDAAAELAAAPGATHVLNAVAGIAGLKPALAALSASRTLLMANKESIVAAGELIADTARRHRARIIPVDSEHSAIFQCLAGRRAGEVRQVILTASGGPFLRRKNFKGITPAQALAHPRWKMGPKVSIDSATLMNKGLELIEASKLFALRPDQVSLVIHPECVVHSLVELTDGSMIAQLAAPDMKIPIAYAMTYPARSAAPNGARISLEKIGRLTFEPPDEKRFPCLCLARAALERGGLAPAALSAADETAVAAFLARKIGFGDIPRAIEAAMEKIQDLLNGDPLDEDGIWETDGAARRATAAFIRKKQGKDK
jgi:1-deoxy-D-xylulose-5-phosphate reductoisomerase